MGQYVLTEDSVNVDGVRAELDLYFAEMKAFGGSEPDEVFMKLAAWSARASEIRMRLCRMESRRAQALRTREVEPFIEELDRQFKFFSRVLTVRDLDQKLNTHKALI